MVDVVPSLVPVRQHDLDCQSLPPGSRVLARTSRTTRTPNHHAGDSPVRSLASSKRGAIRNAVVGAASLSMRSSSDAVRPDARRFRHLYIERYLLMVLPFFAIALSSGVMRLPL